MRRWQMINIPFIGSSSNSGGSKGGVVSRVVSLPRLAIAGLLVVAALVLGGALGVPEGMGVQLVVMLELLAVYLFLHELDAYTFEGFVLVGALTTVIALSATGEPVLASLLNSGPGVILVLGVLYLGYKRLQQRDQSRPTIVLRRDGGGE